MAQVRCAAKAKLHTCASEQVYKLAPYIFIVAGNATLMQRHLTISTKHHNRERTYIIVPAIRLEGKWLEQLGFKRGEKVKLVCNKNKLVIIKEEKN